MPETPTPEALPLPTHIDFSVVARDLKLQPACVEQVAQLLDEGNTIPFITRFRKDLTGGLNEQQILSVKQHVAKLRALTERKSFVLKSIESQTEISDDFKSKIIAAKSIRHLEDLYLPYKPNKQTRAATARQQGLETLAEDIFTGQSPDIDLATRATEYVRVDKGLNSVDDVIRGVGDLLVERFGGHSKLRCVLREQFRASGQLTSQIIEAPVPTVPQVTSETVEVTATPEAKTDSCKTTEKIEKTEPVAEPVSATSSETVPEGAPAIVEAQAEPAEPIAKKKKKRKKKKKKEHDPFKDFENFSQPITKIPPHRILAINRGERAGSLKVKIQADESKLQELAILNLVPDAHPFSEFMKKQAIIALNKVLLPSLDRELRRELTESAERHAVDVFANNLRHLLLQPPIRDQRVLAIDPGFKRGCSIAVLDPFGNLLDSGHIFVVGNPTRRDESKQKLISWIQQHEIDIIAIGNGTACRQTEQLVSDSISDQLQDHKVRYVMVNEAGASIYSTSEVGREEMPDVTPSIRSAASIGRRLQDPLAELVKISPANIGVGMYQHDVKAKHLAESLDEVVQFCVNQVGVDVNSASPSLLKYVSGLNALTARRVVEHRQTIDGFKNRQQLKEVNGVGDTTFVQSAGFLRVRGGDQLLDATSIHPESYELADKIIQQADTTLDQLFVSDADISRKEFVDRLSKLDLDAVANEFETGKLLVRDILLSLKRPNWDPRDRVQQPIFRRGIVKVNDLKSGMQLESQVVNVVDFGIFVDIGLGESSLVHISQLSNRFIRDPHDSCSVGQVIKVWVVDVNVEQRRVKLTAINPNRKPDRPARHANKYEGSKRTKPQAKGKRNTHRKEGPRRPRKPTRGPVAPITDKMLQGDEPMRSFSDLAQFVTKKPEKKSDDGK